MTQTGTDIAQDNASEGGTLNFAEMLNYVNYGWRELCAHYLLLPLILALSLAGLLLMYLVVEPTYMAQATIGPPNPSPTSSMISSMGNVSSGRSVVKRLIGGSSGAADSFGQYQQLLISPGLLVSLAKDDNFLSLIFPEQWDAKNRKWIVSTGLIHDIKVSLKRVLHRQVVDRPSGSQLDTFFKNNFVVAKAVGVDRSSLAGLATNNSDYLTVTITSDDPAKAQKLLSMILLRADNIIRRELLLDVDARISYIEKELPNITQTDQKAALIDMLASQEELRVMLVADKRFAYVMVSVPYSSSVPIKPLPPTKGVKMALLLSIALWGVLVLFGPKVPLVRQFVTFFRRGGDNSAQSSALSPSIRERK